MKKKYMLLYLLIALNIIAASSLVAAKTYSSKVIRVVSQGGEITMPIAISFLAAALATGVSCISAALALKAVSTAGFAASLHANIGRASRGYSNIWLTDSNNDTR